VQILRIFIEEKKYKQYFLKELNNHSFYKQSARRAERENQQLSVMMLQIKIIYAIFV
jgi:hypothetical protein